MTQGPHTESMHGKYWAGTGPERAFFVRAGVVPGVVRWEDTPFLQSLKAAGEQLEHWIRGNWEEVSFDDHIPLSALTFAILLRKKESGQSKNLGAELLKWDEYLLKGEDTLQLVFNFDLEQGCNGLMVIAWLKADEFALPSTFFIQNEGKTYGELLQAYKGEMKKGPHDPSEILDLDSGNIWYWSHYRSRWIARKSDKPIPAQNVIMIRSFRNRWPLHASKIIHLWETKGHDQKIFHSKSFDMNVGENKAGRKRSRRTEQAV
ncbi:uncharacterized protein BXZ73DRAFT_108571 [Epithele typhae]|uniref:uncharacterized protein n=1 Tax=Epithele typhae TaxID=378194 RepID=UPI0020074254|nr:uncharacterized protein BXZ73DRAFT_108571 [Epithele typhae]KAH9910732.1 hypothetical protein BXZ73DRAFT_108571 [Epithele typhae]